MDVEDIIASFARNTGDAVGIGYCDAGEYVGTIKWVNPAFTELFGYTPDEAIGKVASYTFCPRDQESLLAGVVPELAAGRTPLMVETNCIKKSGVRFHASVQFASILDGQARWTTAVYRDVSALRESERAAAAARRERDAARRATERAEARLLTAINAMSSPVAIWDKDYRLVIASEAFSPRLLGDDRVLAPGTPLEEVLKAASLSGQFEDAIGREDEWFKEAVRDIRGGPITHVTRYTDGRVFQAESHHPDNGDTLIVSTDITELMRERESRETYARKLEEANRVARYQAEHDELTGLGNRRHLTNELAAMSLRRRIEGGDICALHIDLDRFKHINDTRGHAVGDLLLKAVARRILDVIGADDVLVRIGGDEFLLLRFCDGDVAECRALAERVVAAVAEPFRIGGSQIRTGASVGIATTAVSDEADLMTDSDIALYKAKSEGRSQVRCFAIADFKVMETTKRLSDDMLCGLETGAFIPHFQPQISAATGQVVALEALARWQHPSRGLIMPGEFLGIAEELSVLDKIDDMIFDAALELCLTTFAGDPCPPSLSFNVSNKRLMSARILEAAMRGRAYRGGVAFELLETVFLDDPDLKMQMQLDALREAGAEIEIDDFGSGHASIIGLEQLAPHRLKIDRRLISAVVESDRCSRMVRSIIEMGRALDIDVTAEGVETVEQAERLVLLGCDRLQGYAFARPAPLAELLPSIRKPAFRAAS